MGKVKTMLAEIRQREQEEGRLSVKEYLSFALTGFGLGSIGAVPGGQRMMFYESIGIPIDRAGSLIFASGIWDLINDPIIATIIDKGKTGPGQKGKFTRWLAPMVPFFAMSSVLLFINPPLNSINAKIAVCFLAYFIYETFATFTGIAWQTMPLIMSPLQDERSNYLTFGNLFGQLTGALPGLIPVAYSLLAESGEARPALLRASTFFTVTAIFFAVMGCTTALFSKNLKERVFAPNRSDHFFENLRTFWNNKYYLLLWTANIPNIFAHVGWTAAPFFFRDSVGNYAVQTLIWTITGVPTVLATLLAPMLIKRFKPNNVVIFSRLLNVCCMLTIFFVTGAMGYTTFPGLAVLVLMFTISSIPSGIAGIANNILNINTFDYTEWKTGERAEATTFVMGGMLNKAMSNIGPLLTGFLMARAGFQEGEGIVQTPRTKDALFMYYILFPAIAGLLGTIPYFFYKLHGPMFDQVQAELAERRKAVQSQSEEDLV